MELSAALLGLIVVLLILVPIIIFFKNASGGDKKVKKNVLQLSETNGIHPKDVEIIGNCVIGVDEDSKKLVYTSLRNPMADFKTKDLTALKDVRAKTIKQSDKTLDWVGLEIVEKASKTEITFYNEHDENELADNGFVCLEIAKRWQNRLRPLLNA